MSALPTEVSGELVRWAWPGGYPLFYLDGDNSVLCPVCAQAARQDRIEHFRPVAASVNYEDGNLYCDNCSARIPSAYAEDQAEPTK